MENKLISLAAAAALAFMAQDAAAQPNRVVVSQGTDSLIFLAGYVAKAKGYFREEGLDGDVRIFRGGVQALAAVMSKDADVYLGPPSTAMKAIKAGQDVTAFGNIMDQIPTNIVIRGDIAKARGITSTSPMTDKIKALKGLTIGVNAAGGAPDQVLQFTLRTAGLDPQKDVTISPVGSTTALIGSFEQKRIDGFAFSSPASDMAVERFGGLMVVNYAQGEYEPLRGFLYLALIGRTEWLNENPDRAARTVRAFGKALKLIHEKPDEARAAVRTFFKEMEEPAFNQGFAANAAAVPADPRITRRSVELNREFLRVVENVTLDVDIDRVYTNRFVDLAEKGK
jgi:NitT/TauT family transport system substrate-binding protein